MKTKALIFLLFSVLFASTFAEVWWLKEKSVSNVVVISNGADFSIWNSQKNGSELTFIDWGIMIPCQNKTVEVWLQNLCEIPVSFSFRLEGNEGLTLTVAEGQLWKWFPWDYPVMPPMSIGCNDPAIDPRRVSVLLTLHVGSSVPIGEYSFTIVFVGEALEH